jgi:hypothetical protein
MEVVAVTLLLGGEWGVMNDGCSTNQCESGKKRQYIFVLVLKARGGVKSAPAMTLGFW